ncbi:MAG TPA: MFS transporter [Fimbriimonadaceae bacterium]|nr:MFS transporter [Fimbriimonadaceae bacterium]
MSKRVKGSVLHANLSPILGIFLTVFIDLLGFGLFIPDLQLRGKEFGVTGYQLGLALGSFSLAQLVTAPILGRISDIYGRRRVLLITTVLSCVAYVIYANATDIWWIVGSRVVSGIAAANVGVAFAYVADITAPEDRAKGMGMVGAAFGAGFVLGPGIGAFLLKLGNDKPLLLGYVGAVMAAINFFYVLFLLPDSAQHQAEAGGHFLENFQKVRLVRGLPLLLLMFFTAQFGFTNLENTFFQLLAKKDWIHHLSESYAREAGAIIMTVVGVTMIFMQGYLIRRLTPKYGEVKLLRFAYAGMAPALVLAPFLPLWIPLLLGTVFLGICTGLAQPSLSSLISRSAAKDIQGGILGINSAVGALARFLGPIVSNWLFVQRPYYPYVLGGLLLAIPAALSWALVQPSLPMPDAAAIMEA